MAKTKKSVKVIKKLRSVSMEDSLPVVQKTKRPISLIAKIILVVAIGSALYLLAQKYRGLFLAGTVNSYPVSRWELNKKMAEKYAKTTFEEIANEKILTDQLKKEAITVTDQEVSDEIAKIVKDYGGEEAFKTALTQYGLTEAKARESIKQSLSLKKLIEKNNKIEITDEQVKKYFADNATLFTGKKLEEVSADIKNTLYQQAIYTKSQEWFTGIRQSAKIVSYL